MNDTLVDIIAALLFLLTLPSMLLLPFSIGKDRGVFTVGNYVVKLVYSLLIMAILGVIFGWW